MCTNVPHVLTTDAMDAPTKPTGPYTTAEEWIDADAAWQQRVYDTGGKKPRLDNPPESMFQGNAEEHAKAVKGRRRVCFREGHPQDRARLLEPHEYNASDNTCKICKGAATKKSKDATRKPVVTYATAEAWFAKHASDTCSKHPEMTVGNCKKPKESQFESTLEFERAKVLHAQREHEYSEQIRQFRDKDAENARKREQYAEDKTTEEGREKLRKKMKQDQENKKKRMLKPAAEEMCKCPVGPHDAPEPDFFFDPVEDLGMTDYKGSRDRTVRRGVCKKHFCKKVMRTRRFNAKPTRKLYNHQREQLVWVKAKRKQWKSDNREHYNTTRRLFFKNNPDKAKARALKCAEYQKDPENAYRLRVLNTEWSARTRGISVELTEGKMRELFSLDARCFHCGVGPTGVRPLGLDQHDHTVKVYGDDTVWPCCTTCNISRGGLTLDAFRQACRNIVTYQDTGVANTVSIPYVMGAEKKFRALRRGVPISILRHRANKHGWVVEFTKEEHDAMRFHSQCYLCGLTGTKDIPLGVDRVDNAKHYTRDNSRPCCTCCNMMKKTTSFDAFVDRCRDIVTQASSPSSSST